MQPNGTAAAAAVVAAAPPPPPPPVAAATAAASAANAVSLRPWQISLAGRIQLNGISSRLLSRGDLKPGRDRSVGALAGLGVVTDIPGTRYTTAPTASSAAVYRSMIPGTDNHQDQFDHILLYY